MSSQGIVELEFSNNVSMWSLLKSAVDTPYLMNYVVDGYEGGNTLVPIETWNDDGIMYREIGKGVYVFPYDSVGFVFDDNIININIYITERFEEKKNYKKEAICVFRIEDTDTIKVQFRDEARIYELITIYLLSEMKVGYDNRILGEVSDILKSLVNIKTREIEYIKSTLFFGAQGIGFVIRIVEKDGKDTFYKVSCFKKVKKKQISEKDIKKVGYLKKKLFEKHPILRLVYYSGILVSLGFLALVLPKILKIRSSKVIIMLAVIAVILLFLRLVKKLFKRNAYRLYNKKSV
jgi:hypothetical protein